MSKAIVWTNAEGGLAVMYLAKEADLPDAWGHVPKGVKASVVEASEIPNDRTFRRAWRHKGGKLEIDMAGAREVWRDHIRRRRKGLLEALDVEYQRADEDGDAAAKAKVTARKKKLRDAPQDPRIEQAATPEDLLKVDPLA